MTNEPLSAASLQPDLATYLFARREAILNGWRTRCEQDTTILATSGLSREEFNDMVPTMLNILGQRLVGQPAELDPMQVANEHGLHRWHKGYTLRELLKEIGHLFRIVSDELKTYAELYPATNVNVLTRAYGEIIGINEETLEGSAARYDDLERTAAASRADALQGALNQLNELARQRSDLLRTSSHDLRSSVGIAQGAVFMLDLDNQSPEERNQLMAMLNRNLTNLETMLQSLMSLARLEAGQETPEISEFDVAALLHELVQGAQPLAIQQGLPLLADGPEQLVVKSDPGKVRRIVQNLLLNALMYTEKGVVSISWVEENDHQWTVGIQDTGPGLPDSSLSSIVGTLKPTQDSASVFDSRVKPELPVSESPGPPRQPNAIKSKGEGVGLHIVKRLCELLEANLDIETSSDKGTLVRVRFPRRFKSE
ncbi:HAMP domain-containing histidine kinase [Spirosoma aureum]|uniref:histidine kinase n=1 Tax=Spirosoma aureum TaxID=2692134 RepID=A0A6G9AX53_9BACT|nr:HAMP domain-containing sensor histidine kinase [Spirosoma aureum]QIP16954.1 HAMP domain-containing histidine kinase [Spirosoma aureum]